MQEFTGLRSIDLLFADAEERSNEQGNRTREIFISTDRYLFDFKLVFGEDAWSQFDTASDAHYFGVWVHKSERLVLCYAEGDLSLTRCLSAKAYDDEMESLCTFHQPTPAVVTFSEEGRTAYYQDRADFFIEPARGAAFQLKEDEEGSE